MNIQRIAAFSQGTEGGNPAGIVLLEQAESTQSMARVAAQIGYSETAFAVKQDISHETWRVRYFSPESEVPFCGHATIALGAALGREYGSGSYSLILNKAQITVSAENSSKGVIATLTSPPTKSRVITAIERQDVMALFNLADSDLDKRIEPAFIHGGANHVVLPLKSREALAAMDYDLDAGRTVMRKHDLVTVMMVYIQDERTFVVRNAFASGGVFEDPATGAAAAAFAGYLRDCEWPHAGSLTIRQGEDMGSPSLINVSLSNKVGSPVRVSGSVRDIR